MSNNDNDGIGSGERRAKRATVADPAPPETFLKTMQANALDVAADLRFEDWSDVAFDGQDLSGCDFTGAVIANCTFDGAKLGGARFDGAVLGTSHEWDKQTELAWASDWLQHCAAWSAAKDIPSDRHVSAYECIQDAPFAPRLVLLPRRLAEAKDLVWGRDVGFLRQQRFVAPMPVTALQLLPYCGDLPEAQRGRFAALIGTWEKMLPEQADVLARNIVPLTWDEGNRYLKWLNERTGRSEKHGRQYRRLSEAEWEFAYANGVISNTGDGECWYEWLEDHWLQRIETTKSDGSAMLKGDPAVRVARSSIKTKELSSIARRKMRADTDSVAALRVARLWAR